MTAKELIIILQRFPDEAPVLIWDFGVGGVVEADNVSEYDGACLIESSTSKGD